MKKLFCVLFLGAFAIGLLAPSVSHVAWWYDPEPNVVKPGNTQA